MGKRNPKPALMFVDINIEYGFFFKVHIQLSAFFAYQCTTKALIHYFRSHIQGKMEY